MIFQSPDGEHRRDELLSIAVWGGLARADDRYAVGTLGIRERGELPVSLLFELLVGKGNEGVRPGSCGYKALCDFLRFAAGPMKYTTWESASTSGVGRRVRQVCYEHGRSPATAICL
jgi:hypothetical protein